MKNAKFEKIEIAIWKAIGKSAEKLVEWGGGKNSVTLKYFFLPLQRQFLPKLTRTNYFPPFSFSTTRCALKTSVEIENKKWGYPSPGLYNLHAKKTKNRVFRILRPHGGRGQKNEKSKKGMFLSGWFFEMVKFAQFWKKWKFNFKNPAKRPFFC